MGTVVDVDADVAKDIESLWEEHNTLKTAFSNLEVSVKALTNNSCNLTTSLEGVKSALAKILCFLEKKKDARLVTFIEQLQRNVTGTY